MKTQRKAWRLEPMLDRCFYRKATMTYLCELKTSLVHAVEHLVRQLLLLTAPYCKHGAHGLWGLSERVRRGYRMVAVIQKPVQIHCLMVQRRKVVGARVWLLAGA